MRECELPGRGSESLRFIVVSALLIVTHVNSVCHERCNLNGQCISNGTYPNGICVCNNISSSDYWMGVDCSEKSCPKGIAWVDYASGSQVAHADGTECSNMGQCDRETGLCTCRNGWTGPSCNRLLCPGFGGGAASTPNTTVCSGRGRCTDMETMGTMNDGRATTNDYAYSLWDKNMIFGCMCDPGYTGYDCGQRTCPTGDDPLTTGQADEVQVIECTADGGSFAVTFKGVSSANILAASTAELLKYELEQMKTVTAVAVTLFGSATGTICDGDGVSIQFAFTHNPGDLPAMVLTTAALTLSTGTAAMSLVAAGASGTNGGTSVTGTKEDIECSGRGECDRATGVCHCNTNFAGSNGAGAAGNFDNCGFQTATITACDGDVYTTPGTEECGGVGVGTCSGATTFVCTCAAGYEGSNCQTESCPTGATWFEEPTGTNTAHTTAVACSGRGVCTAGSCVCADGFFGTDCATTSCAGSPECNGVGTCSTMAELAVLGKDSQGQLIPGAAYSTPWDANKMKGCHCTTKHYGPWPYVSKSKGFDCMLRDCPTGDDADTPGQHHETQTIWCVATGGTFTLTWRDITTAAIAFDADAATVQAAFRLAQRKSIGLYKYQDDGTTVVLRTSDGGNGENGWTGTSTAAAACAASPGVFIDITFASDLGDVPQITSTGALTGTDADIYNGAENPAGTYENVMCGNNGICTEKVGTCECIPGYDSSDGSGAPGNRGDCGYKLPFPNVYYEIN